MSVLDSPLLTPEQVSSLLSIQVQTLAQMRVRGDGPTFIKLPNRSIRYRATDVDLWIDAGAR